jgi:hypothetical protein
LLDRFRAIWSIRASADLILDYGIKHEIARICELTEILSKVLVSLSLVVQADRSQGFELDDIL